MPGARLSHWDCVRLVGTPERGRLAMVSIDGRTPVRLACVLLDSGDLLIPAGRDRSLPRSAAGRPVIVEFTHHDRAGNVSWAVTGMGLGRTMRHRDQPVPLPRTTVTASMSAPFENGVRVDIARYRGTLVVADIPRQRGPESSVRTGGAPAAESPPGRPARSTGWR